MNKQLEEAIRTKNALTRYQATELELDTSEYHYNDETGVFHAKLDYKIYGKNSSIMLFMTFDDGRKVISVAPMFMVDAQKLVHLPMRSRVVATYTATSRGRTFITKLSREDNENE